MGLLKAPGNVKSSWPYFGSLTIQLFLFTALLGLTHQSLGQVIAGFDVNGQTAYGTSPLAPMATAGNVTITGLTRGSGVTITGTAAARGWGGNGWAATAADGITGNKFVTFSAKANAGFALSLSSIDPLAYRRSGTGPTNALVQYQINADSFVDVATISFPVTTAGGGQAGPIPLTAITALQNLPSASTVTFRIVPYGATSTGGTWYIYDVSNSTASDLALNGTVATEGPVTPTVTLLVNPTTGTEAGTTVITVTATASAAVTGDQTVNLAVTGTGITTGDYTLSGTTITIPNGATSGSVTFTVINDTDAEGTETATLTLSSPSSGIALGSPITQTITITDDDAPAVPTVNLSVSTNTATEADATVVTVTATSSSAVTSNQTVNLAVTGTGITAGDYSLSGTTITIPNGATSGSVTFTVVNDTDFEPTETATLTISSPSAGIALGTTTTQTITITDNDAGAATLIHDIQGSTHISPRAGQAVNNVPGIVTALRGNGFWIQDPNPDANDNTSEGIFVFTSTAPTVAVGNAVSINGTVQEFRANVQNLSITQLISPVITTLSTGNALPAPIVISSQAGARQIPTNVISNDFPADGDVELSTFDPTEDGLDFYETLEGMRVQINNPVTTGLRSANGELYVIADAGAGATGVNARGGITISGANTTDIASAITNSDFNPERLQIDDVLYGTGNTPNVNVGTKLNTIIGVVSYDFQSYEILPSIAPTVSASNVPLTKETTTLAPTLNQLTIASFNVENLAGSEPQAKYDGLAGAIKNNLQSPDIIALEEIQDNNGATNDAVVDAATTLNRLISAITAAGGPTYEYRQINPVDDQDGGQPGGNIRVGLLFNPARVQFVDRPGGGSTTNTTVSDVGGLPRLSASPGRIIDTNPGEADSYPGDDFTATRKPLVGEFTFNGQPVYVIVNHFSSRGGSGALSQRFQPPVQAEQGRREEQAKVVNAFVDQLLAVNATTNVVVLGDFNEFQFLPALQYLKGNVGGETPVLTNLIETLPPQERYTYTFDGNAQALDYILASTAMTSKLDAFDAVHINAEFTDQLSDHDPSVARFTFPAAPMPVRLVYMRGEWVSGEGSVLSWQTSVEINNDHFDIERGTDAKSFEKIGRVAGKGMTSERQNYRFVDADAPGDVTYYRLKQVDVDGSFAYSQIVAVRRGVESIKLTLWPNPASEKLSVNVTGVGPVTRLRVFDTQGRLLSESQQTDKADVSALKAGQYVLEIQTKTGQTLRQRFIKP